MRWEWKRRFKAKKKNDDFVLLTIVVVVLAMANAIEQNNLTNLSNRKLNGKKKKRKYFRQFFFSFFPFCLIQLSTLPILRDPTPASRPPAPKFSIVWIAEAYLWSKSIELSALVSTNVTNCKIAITTTTSAVKESNREWNEIAFTVLLLLLLLFLI